jgi:hypothetical protein
MANKCELEVFFESEEISIKMANKIFAFRVRNILSQFFKGGGYGNLRIKHMRKPNINELKDWLTSQFRRQDVGFVINSEEKEQNTQGEHADIAKNNLGVELRV